MTAWRLVRNLRFKYSKETYRYFFYRGGGGGFGRLGNFLGHGFFILIPRLRMVVFFSRQ